MIDPELVRQFGLPVVIYLTATGLLVFLVRQATDERKTITDRFLTSLEGVVKDSTEARLRSAATLEQLTGAIRDHERRSSEEHGRILDRLSLPASR